MQKGYSLAILAALISGFSIFLNYFGASGMNAVLFAALKNSLVAMALFSLLVLLREKEIKKIKNKKAIGKLALIGLIGGSIPFALFFTALRSAGPLTAGFVHKTLFIWAAIFAVVLLRERIDKKFLAGAALLFAGNLLVFAPSFEFSIPLLMVLIATLLWGLESVVSKHALKELSGSTVAFGRMFFGSAFLLLFFSFTGGVSSAFSLSMQQIQWTILTSAFLFLYVFAYYNALKRLPVHKATSALLLAQPITASLSFLFLGKQIALAEGLGMLLVVSGAMTIIGFSYFSRLAQWGVSIARQ